MAGHTDGKVTMYARDTILASTAVLEIISILIDKTTTDAGNLDGVTNLRPGLVLARDAVTGKYKPAATGDEADAVVLQHEIRGIDGGDQTASAFYIATIWADALHSVDVLDWTANKRISIMERV